MLSRPRTVVYTLMTLVLMLLFAGVGSYVESSIPINMWIASQPAAVNNWVPLFVKSFNERNPSVKLNVEIYQYVSAVRDKLILAIASGTAPDIFYDAGNLAMKWAYMNVSIPLDKYYNNWSGKKDIIPDILYNIQYKGQYYALPFSFWPSGDVYNLDILVNSGVQEPKTWDEMLNVAKKTRKTTDGNKNDIIGYYKDLVSGTVATIDLELAVNQLGTTTLSPEATNAKMNNDAGRRALQYLIDIRIAGMGEDMTSKSLTGGKVAIWHSYGGYDFLNKVVNIAPSTKWGFRRYVGPNVGKDTIQINVGTFMITTTCKYPDEAWRVLADFMDQENLMAYLQAHGSSLPTRISLVYDKRLSTNDILFQELLPTVRTPMTSVGPMHPYFTDIREQAGGPILKAITGKASSGTALEEAEQIANIRLQELMKQ